ncbi:RING-H2 finger protein ATL8-like [Gastrolobium bilobum]|uniref:RING-H2 finger protein ATL8-like n=1 Tax=Gastrolobium bilobum TaxID=150636 RepID=UPI002AB04765|nr:RING-H2 finger protein ATL8-like [Gastrolobium bilobum]
MTATLRILHSTNSATAAVPPEAMPVGSDFIVILAALLCVLVCLVGLIAIARCAWLRRRTVKRYGHGFHVTCIDTWLGSHSSCPSCRAILAVARCQKCGQYPAEPPP